MLKLTPGLVTMGGEDTEVTIDPMDTMVMVTMERDLLMMPLPNLAPTPTPLLTPGTGTMGTDMVTMVTMERDLLMSLPLPSLALTPMPRLTPGTGTTGMLTGLTVMDTGV